MRLFVAVLPPAEALQGLCAAVEPVRALPGADRLRWTAVEGWHLTLAFLGQVPAERLPELEAALAAVAAVHPAHRLRIAGSGRFGERVLWAGVEGRTRELRRLAEAVIEAVAEVGGEPDAVAFHPHLTLARAGSPRGHRRAVQRVAAAELDALAAALAPYRGPEWEAAELHLMKSDLDGGFAHYESLRSWALAD
ncbi:RNA 2',3'-cyclic phosphodiesterase [Streptomyces sp. CBMA123]|uniref:RNA 2',3'-cyclic phosphodiesterase n=1 Tax=Streptomyces sp. CBMA123 TaxID=1896313 RepID=UPI001661E648|nr:RNA 2',3'-cyclic phosphodiesterase [Streptomyces sp. CBMA123]MBD0690847.1 2'-5' RNA ligase [Streptomyces sp. CBMA123]